MNHPRFKAIPGPRLLWFGGLFLLLLAGRSTLAAAQDQPTGLDVRIGRPAEGETFYSGPDSLLYSIPINGWAFSDSYPSAALEVQLEVVQGHTVLSSQALHPDPDGSFLFKAEVNPGSTLASFEIAFQGCADKCHDLSAQRLPVGTFLLRVTARDPAGGQARDQRQVTVDRAAIVDVPVQLVLASGPQGAAPELPAGIQVNGGALLYLWRNRGALGTSDSTGLASVPVEVLSQAPTHYTFEVQEQVVAGVWVRGLESVDLTLQPGQTTIPTLTLPVQAQVGRIQGELAAPGDARSETLPVWAFELPAGQAHQTQVAGAGGFSFTSLPIGQYLLTADPQILSAHGCWSESVVVDLAADPQEKAELAVDCPGNPTLQGVVQEEGQSRLPFARVEVDQGPESAAVQPDRGTFQLPGGGQQDLTLIASAPGYYSQARRSSTPAGEALVFNLVRRPDTTALPWGAGEIILPPESHVVQQGETLLLTSGWIWGRGGSAEPLVIEAAGLRLIVNSGRFALVIQPGDPSWFYLFDGQAEARQPGGPAVPLTAGQMLFLSATGRLTPVDYQPALVQALSQRAPDPRFNQVWQPTPRAILRDRLARLGLNTAQALTFLVYTLALISLLVGPLIGLLVLLRRRMRH